MKVEIACGCGAALGIEGADGRLSDVMRHVRSWQREHQHPQPQGAAAIGYPLPEANGGYDETGQPHGRRIGFK